MSKSTAIVPTQLTGTAEVIEGSRDYVLPRIGDWFWMSYEGHHDPEDLSLDFEREVTVSKKKDKYGRQKYTSKVLVVVTHIGSNFVELQNPEVRRDNRQSTWGGGSYRIHIEQLEDLIPEPNAKDLILRKMNQHRLETARLLGEVNDITRRLGIGQQALTGEAESVQEQTGALVRVTSDMPVKTFKEALVTAKEKTLPELFKLVENENALMAAWMTAELIPMRAAVSSQLDPIIKRIDNRIFNVELYAGLVETVKEVRGGTPASVAEPLHLMQRRHYMDEECLLDYDAGGMNFTKLEDFDAWLMRPQNFNRLLPFPRCVVAFRVRRYKKDYQWKGGTIASFLGFAAWASEAEKADAWTFLYLRNGDQLHRLNTSVEFGEELFPDEKLRHLTGALMAKNERGSWDVITKHDWEERKAAFGRAVSEHSAKQAEYEQARAAWEKKYAMYFENNKDRFDGSRMWCSATYAKRLAKLAKEGGSYKSVVSGKEMVGAKHDEVVKDHEAAHNLGYYQEKPKSPTTPVDLSAEYEPFNDNSVYYDDIQKHLANERERHNRLVLVLQGLLDRSPVFHPHPKWELWTEVGFNHALVLHYDSKRALVPGEAPDFEAFRKKLNQHIKPGSVVVGAHAFWRAQMKNNSDSEYDSGGRRRRSYERSYRLNEDPGPGIVARVVKVVRGKAVFEWTRRRQSWRHNRWTGLDAPIVMTRMKLSVPLDKLLCLDSYEPGSYKQFFADPRTRADYLQWVPFLFRAEDYAAGKVAVRGEGVTAVENDDE